MAIISLLGSQSTVSSSYSIGGSINGLVGSVILQNNGVDNLSLTDNGIFAFASIETNGTTYSVTVLTNPTGQTCTASSNTGTVSTANITNIIITCSNESYTVGGTLSGVTGTLILQNNGADNLSLTANASFIFGASVANGSTYSLTIFTQSVGQTCTISNGTGTITAASVTNISITCISNGYTIGGSLAGLTGTILLQNNLGDNLSISTNGIFTFVTGLMNGTAYSVTILTQPLGQTCNISTNTGTISTANVNTVSVTCNSNSYTVGGSIAGISGTVVLQDNLGDNLSRAANGAFTFATSVVNGTNYSVTVLTNPVGQTCSASTSSGTINAANITTVSVTCSMISYTVGGSITGLTGTVVLQDNFGDNLSSAANGSFTFATSVANGSAYSVTVLTQPSGQTCSPSVNTGTIAASNVTNVSITCSSNSYTVGGSIAGLTGTIVLQDNLGDNLSRAANGAFTFATGVTNGATYSVTILTQPSGQTCSPSVNTGTIAASNVTNVSITCSSNSYTVGGSIAGLTGTIVLQDNLGDNLSRAANGAFTFATGVTNGATYSVTVLTQPSGQICTASTNTGTISATNVTNVSIVCVTTYTVGGTITGLVGTVILQDNLADNLNVAANGTFTFATGILNAGAYSVTILTQPANKTCVITIASGTIAAANITSVVVTCSGNANGILSSGTIVHLLNALTGGVTTFAGSPCAANTVCATGTGAYVDSPTPTIVQFGQGGPGGNPEGITTDGENIYVADKKNEVIRKVVLATGATTTLAGNGVKALLDGTGTAASFDDPKYIITDGINIYVGDSANKAIRKLNIATTVVTTIATDALLLGDPKGMAIYNNNLYVSDNIGNAIRQIDLSTNALTTVISAGITTPGGMALHGSDLYISEKSTDIIYKTTIGIWTLTPFVGTGVAGYTNGTGLAAQLKDVEGMICDGTNLFIADSGNNAIRKIVIATAVVTTLAGPETLLAGYTNNSTSLNALFDKPLGIISDGAKIYTMDSKNFTIRRIE